MSENVVAELHPTQPQITNIHHHSTVVIISEKHILGGVQSVFTSNYWLVNMGVLQIVACWGSSEKHHPHFYHPASYAFTLY